MSAWKTAHVAALEALQELAQASEQARKPATWATAQECSAILADAIEFDSEDGA